MRALLNRFVIEYQQLAQAKNHKCLMVTSPSIK